ncbi:hypothetical protein OC842_007458, partial [Tilletia horrida]
MARAPPTASPSLHPSAGRSPSNTAPTASRYPPSSSASASASASSTSHPGQAPPTFLYPGSSSSAMGSGWGPPPSLQRLASGSHPANLVYPSQHGLPLSPANHSPAPSSASAPTPMHPPAPPPPPPHASTSTLAALYDSRDPGAEDYGQEAEDYDEEDEEDEDDEEDDEEDGTSVHNSSMISKKRKRKSGGVGAAFDPQALSASGSGSAGGAQEGPSTSADGTQEPNSLMSDQPPEKKPKVSRGSKACTNCRRLKMRCVPSDQEGGHPCKRCLNSGGNCVFEASQRGKRTTKGKKAEAMAASLKKMEETLNSVLRSIRDPASAGGGAVDLTGSYSVTGDFVGKTLNEPQRSPFEQYNTTTATTAAATARVTSVPAVPARTSAAVAAVGASPGGQHINPASISAPPPPSGNLSSSRSSHGGSQGTALSPEQERGSGNLSHQDRSRGADGSSASGSSHDPPYRPMRHRIPRKSPPRLHSLPDNSLNPLGLLAEASLHNTERLHRKALQHRRGASFTSSSREGGAQDEGDDSGISPAAASERSAPAAAEGRHAAIAEEPASMERARSRAKTIHATPGDGTHLKAVGAGAGANSGKGTAEGAADEIAAADGEDEDGAPRFVPAEGDFSRALGVASSSYFKPGPLSNLALRRIVIEREIPPQLLTQGIISSEEILELFQIFFHNCSTHVILLDPEMHTPALICARSPFLFSAVCTVASRFYSHKRPDLYAKCLAESKRCAYDIMSRGYKSVEIVQGFLLLSLWTQPSERYETDKTWLFSGVAMRMATDLNLHRKSTLTLPPDVSPNDPVVLEWEREILNRERTWFLCFTMDRNLAATMGKPYTIREDFLIRNCKYWCEQRASRPWDIALASLVELLRLTSRMLDMLYSSTRSVNGLNLELDYSTMLRIWNEQLEEVRDQWAYKGIFPSVYRPRSDPFDDIKSRLASQRAHIERNSPPVAAEEGAEIADAEAGTGKEGKQKQKATDEPITDPAQMKHDQRLLHFYVKQAPLRWHYAVLIINSFGLQRALDTNSEEKGYFFLKCQSAAKGMVKAALDGLRPVLRYAPDAQFVMISYACVFMLKLLRKEFRGWIDEEEVTGLISQVIDTLDEVAVNETHTPALHATFLRRLLNARAETRPGSPYASAYHSRAETPAPAAGAAGGAGAGASGSGLGDHPSFGMTPLDGRRNSTMAGGGQGQGLPSAFGSRRVSTEGPGGLHGSGDGLQSSAGNAGGEGGLDSLGALPNTLGSTFGSAFGIHGSAPFGASNGNGLGAMGPPNLLHNSGRFNAFSPNIVSSSPARFVGDEPATMSGEASSHMPFAGFDASGQGGMGMGGMGMGMGMNLDGNSSAAAAIFGASSLAQLFPSNTGFSGSGAPADSSHAAAMHFGGGGGMSQAHADGAASGSAGAGQMQPPTGGGHQQQHSHNHQHHHPQPHHIMPGLGGSNGGAGAGNAAATNSSGAMHGGSAQLMESVFDDTFWSTLLPPGFGTSSSLNAPTLDFSSAGGMGGAGIPMGLGMGFGGG